MYVTFREKFVKRPKAQDVEQEGKFTIRELFKNVIIDYLFNAQDNEEKLQGVDLS